MPPAQRGGLAEDVTRHPPVQGGLRWIRPSGLPNAGVANPPYGL